MSKLHPLAAPLFESVAIIGIGLIGSSIARAAARVKAAGRLVICDRDEKALSQAKHLGLGDAYETSAAEGRRGRAPGDPMCSGRRLRRTGRGYGARTR